MKQVYTSDEDGYFNGSKRVDDNYKLSANETFDKPKYATKGTTKRENGIYFNPKKLSVFVKGVYLGLYLEIKTGDVREYYPGQMILYFKRVTDSYLEVTYDLPNDLIDGRIGV